MIALGECGPRGVDYLRSFPLSVPVWIISSIVVRLANCLKDQPTLYWSNN